MPGEDLSNLVGACNLSELINKHEYDTHRDMIRDLDEEFTVSNLLRPKALIEFSTRKTRMREFTRFHLIFNTSWSLTG